MRSQEEIEERVKSLLKDRWRVYKKMRNAYAVHDFEEFSIICMLIRNLLWVLKKDESYLEELEGE